jgi:hypothetical protein
VSTAALPDDQAANALSINAVSLLPRSLAPYCEKWNPPSRVSP